jgi:uncharacterized membrane protein
MLQLHNAWDHCSSAHTCNVYLHLSLWQTIVHTMPMQYSKLRMHQMRRAAESTVDLSTSAPLLLLLLLLPVPSPAH